MAMLNVSWSKNMKQKILFLYLVLVVTTCFIGGCVEDQGKIEDDMNTVTVDSGEFVNVMAEANTAYIKALVSTSQKNISASESSIDLLVNKLTYIADTYGEAPPEVYGSDNNWTADIRSSVQIAESSQQLLNSGDIEAAHLALEPMRDLFFNLHERNGIIYMGDRLTIFHTTMEEAIDAANTNDTEMVATYIPKLESEWQLVKDSDRPDTADESYDQILGQVDDAIGALNNSVVSGNSTEIQTNSENLRLAFAKVFAKYGVVIS